MSGLLPGTREATDRTLTDGLLRTGDLGYKDEEDYVFIVDRLKELIKCKGFQGWPPLKSSTSSSPIPKSRTPPSSGRPIRFRARSLCLRGSCGREGDCSAEALIEYAARAWPSTSAWPGGVHRYDTHSPSGRFTEDC